MRGITGLATEHDLVQGLLGQTFGLQHRGQTGCGIAVANNRTVHLPCVGTGLVRDVLVGDMDYLEGYTGIGATISHGPLLPFPRADDYDQGVFAFDGYIGEHDERELLELLHATVLSSCGDTSRGISKLYERRLGHCNMVVLTPDGVFASRDPSGMHPLVLGRSDNGTTVAVAVASESCAFFYPGLELVRDVAPGEIVRLHVNLIETVGQLEPRRRRCVFEWIYFARLDSTFDGLAVDLARKRLGGYLAEHDDVEADIVAPVPFSGVGHAVGFHRVSGLPYDNVFLLPQFHRRSYNLPIAMRLAVLRGGKLVPIRNAIKDKRIVLVDDSIRGGHTMRGLIEILRANGAREVHIRIASPISVRYCPHVAPPSEQEVFIASSLDVNGIRVWLGADTLTYQTIGNVVRAIGMPERDLCLDCFKCDKAR